MLGQRSHCLVRSYSCKARLSERNRAFPRNVPTFGFATSSEATFLREAFDRPEAAARRPPSSSTGLLGYGRLTAPAHFIAAGDAAQSRAQHLVEHLSNEHASSAADAQSSFLAIVRLFDRLSDTLCKVIDLAEAIRSVHPDPSWVEAAEQVHTQLHGYMNTLNTHVGLYQCLERAFDRLPDRHDSSLFAARQVALQFLRDFRTHGIHLDVPVRTQIVALSDDIARLGRAFLNGAVESSAVGISERDLQRLGGRFAARVYEDRKGDVVAVQSGSWAGTVLARQHPDPEIRKRFWVAQNTASSAQIQLLHELLRTRASFAGLTGKKSWAHMILEDKMAGSPDNVQAFLEGVASKTQPRALEEIHSIRRYKERHSPVPLQPWDYDYYSSQMATSAPALGAANLSSYFSLGRCLEGLSHLFTDLFGIHMIPELPLPGETWDPEVRKLGVYDGQNRVATIYCDLYHRAGKPSGAAHYTVLCSRRVDWDIAMPLASPTCASELEPPREALSTEPDGRTMQLPIVVLSCDFDKPDSRMQPALLSWAEVETLWHEMGHAVHSVVGRTEYHNVAGTRCPTDLVEVPSILMEHFLTAPPVLRLFAFHHQDGRPLPEHMLHAIVKEGQSTATEANLQILMSMVDQTLHTIAPQDRSFDSSLLWHQIVAKWGTFAPVPGTSWQGKFGHLVGYGATYYAYLMDRMLASAIWQSVFASNPLDRDAGERYKYDLLQWGGGKDSWECIGELLGNDDLRAGGADALRHVASMHH